MHVPMHVLSESYKERLCHNRQTKEYHNRHTKDVHMYIS